MVSCVWKTCHALREMLLLRDVVDRHGRDLEAGAIVIAMSTKFRIRRPQPGGDFSIGT